MPYGPVPPADLTGYARVRDALLDRIVATLEADARVRAVWLSGSFGRDEADEWSDLDLHVAVEDADFDAFLAERPALYERVGRPVLVQQEIIPSNSMPGGHFQLVMYAGPIEVDWNFGPAGQAARPPASRVLFDRIGVPVHAPPAATAEERRAKADASLTFFWAMAPIAVKHAGRGASQRAASQIDLLTETFVILWRLVELPDGPDPYAENTNRPIEPELEARLPRLGREICPAMALAVIRNLCAEVERLHPALASLGAPVPTGMIE
jgi:predicted nucleotidyltransferase